MTSFLRSLHHRRSHRLLARHARLLRVSSTVRVAENSPRTSTSRASLVVFRLLMAGERRKHICIGNWH